MLITETINGIEVPIYVWPNSTFPFYYYFQHEKCRIFILSNIVHNFLWLKEVKNNIRSTDYFFVQTGWHANNYICNKSQLILDYLGINKDQFIVMCNAFDELQRYLDRGFINSILLNHNAWIDENLYTIMDINKIYDALLIGRADNCKRLYLANKVKNLALVTGERKYGDKDVVLPPHINNDNKRLNEKEMTTIINQSYCGLCLSAEEGACNASSEYLLCGIPVVSTLSRGGRDIWYDEDNSIICNDNEDDIAMAVKQIRLKKYDPEQIRQKHISLSKYFRSIFIDKLQQIFNKHNISIDAEQYYINNYINQMKQFSTNDEVIDIINGIHERTHYI